MLLCPVLTFSPSIKYYLFLLAEARLSRLLLVSVYASLPSPPECYDICVEFWVSWIDIFEAILLSGIVFQTAIAVIHVSYNYLDGLVNQIGTNVLYEHRI